MYPPVSPIIVQLGPFALRWYGLLMAIAVILAAQLASREVERRGLKSDDLWDLLLWVVIPGFLGARLYYVFIQSPRAELGSSPASSANLGRRDSYLWRLYCRSDCVISILSCSRSACVEIP